MSVLVVFECYLYSVSDNRTCDDGICSGHGVCEEITGSEYLMACLCNRGYHGPACGNNIDECLSNPCQNDGVCMDGVAMYMCTCTQEYIGVHCQEFKYDLPLVKVFNLESEDSEKDFLTLRTQILQIITAHPDFNDKHFFDAIPIFLASKVKYGMDLENSYLLFQ